MDEIDAPRPRRRLKPAAALTIAVVSGGLAVAFVGNLIREFGSDASGNLGTALYALGLLVTLAGLVGFLITRTAAHWRMTYAGARQRRMEPSDWRARREWGPALAYLAAALLIWRLVQRLPIWFFVLANLGGLRWNSRRLIWGLGDSLILGTFTDLLAAGLLIWAAPRLAVRHNARATTNSVISSSAPWAADEGSPSS